LMKRFTFMRFMEQIQIETQRFAQAGVDIPCCQAFDGRFQPAGHVRFCGYGP
jgi:hypothetical protein